MDQSVVEWLRFGVLGLVVLSMIVGWLVPGRIYDRAIQRAERLEEENQRLRERLEEQVIPLLTRVMDVLDRRESR